MNKQLLDCMVARLHKQQDDISSLEMSSTKRAREQEYFLMTNAIANGMRDAGYPNWAEDFIGQINRR